MTIENKEINTVDTSDISKQWDNQLEKDSDILDLLAEKALGEVSDEDFEDDDWE